MSKEKDQGSDWLENTLKVDPPEKSGDDWMKDGVKKLGRKIAHSDDRAHSFRRIATTYSDRSRPVWRGA